MNISCKNSSDERLDGHFADHEHKNILFSFEKSRKKIMQKKGEKEVNKPIQKPLSHE